MSTVHVRGWFWFAAGVAVTMIATVAFTAVRAGAVSDGEASFVPITPCRLVDTRPETQVGSKSSPVGPTEAFVLQVTGNVVGECSIPTAATAVSINLTGVLPTAATFVSLYPADQPNPGTSVLNLVAGQAPAPNKLDVKLSPDGRVVVFNQFGSVHIVGDVMGYYRTDGLTDLDTRLAALEAADLAARVGDLEAAEPFSVSATNGLKAVTPTAEVVVSVEVTAPVAGHVVVNSTSAAFEGVANDHVRCSITTGSTIDTGARQFWESAGSNGAFAQLAGTRGFDITAGATITYNLVCEHVGTSGTTGLIDSWLTAIFTPAP